MNLKGDCDIRESGKYIILFEDEESEEWEVEFEIRVDKDYIYEETGRFLTDVYVQAKCTDTGFTVEEEISMEVAIEEYITSSFNL